MAQDQDHEQQRQLYRGAGEGWQRAFELAATPLLIGALGYWLDGRLGWTPILTLVFGVLAAVGTVAKIYYQYKAAMEAHDAAAPWGRAKAAR